MPTLLERAIPIENGDHFSVGEFLRRCEQHPTIKKAELIEGRVHILPGIRAEHGQADGFLHG
jgi:hypothetical protein